MRFLEGLRGKDEFLRHEFTPLHELEMLTSQPRLLPPTKSSDAKAPTLTP